MRINDNKNKKRGGFPHDLSMHSDRSTLCVTRALFFRYRRNIKFMSTIAENLDEIGTTELVKPEETNKRKALGQKYTSIF